MKSSLLIIVIVWLLSSCSGDKELPPDIIALNQMKTIVWDLEIADQQSGDRFQLPQQRDSLRMEATSLYQQVFAKHKTNKASFYKSFSFYEAHPNLMKTLLDSVTSYGNRRKTDVYKRAY